MSWRGALGATQASLDYLLVRVCLEHRGVDRPLIAVSGVRSSLHALHLVAWLNDDLDASPDAVRIRCLDSISAAQLESYRPGLVSDDPGVPVCYVCVGNPSPRLALELYRQGFRGGIVVIDEGLGSYGNAYRRYQALRREGRSWARGVARALVRQTIRHWGQRWPSYRRVDGRWEPNPVVGAEFRRRAPQPDPDPQRVVLLLQPWRSLGIQSASEQRQVIQRIDEVVRVAGGHLLVRPHPVDRDHLIESDVEVSSTSGLAEHDPVVLGAGLVIGETSTSLINLAAFLARPTLAVRTPATPGISRVQFDLLTTFVGPPIETSALTVEHLHSVW